jgi:hypothetical protein
VQGMRGAPSAAGGDYTLRITTRDGRTIEQSFDAELVDHAMPPERQFAFTVVDPGPLARLEIARAGNAIPLRASSMATAQRAGETATRGPLTVDWSERGGVLELRWNAVAAPYLSVTHVGAERRALAVNHRSGQASIAVDHLPAGGKFEFALSDGLNAQLIHVDR